MHSLSERAKIVLKWLASYTKATWQFSDYPRRVRPNSANDPSIAWMAQFLNWPGPVGLGASPTEAVLKLEGHFNELRLARERDGESLPRPGVKEPIRFAPSNRVMANAALLDDFLNSVLGFGPSDPVFVSDESSLHDFSSDDEDIQSYCALIRSRYGVDVSDLQWLILADILERIGERRSDG